MRIIAVKTLKEYGKLFPKANQAILAWYEEVELAEWKNHNELKAQYRHSSIVSSRKVVFNIHGNDYRLVVDMDYKFGIIFIIWFGTHNEYNKLDINSLRYVKTNKK